MSNGLVVGDGEHLEEESEVLDVVGVVVVVDVEPVHGVGLGVAVADCTGGHPAGDEDGGGEGSGALGGDEAEVVVALHVLLLELVEVLDAVDAELVEVLLELRGELGHVRLAGLALPVGRDEVVGLPQNLVEAHGKSAALLLVGEGADTLEARRGGRGRGGGGGDRPASAGRDGRADGGGGEAHGCVARGGIGGMCEKEAEQLPTTKPAQKQRVADGFRENPDMSFKWAMDRPYNTPISNFTLKISSTIAFGE